MCVHVYVCTLFSQLGVAVEAPLTISRCVDAIISLLIEPLCVHPTFLLHHPRAMCPLARSHRHHVRMVMIYHFL